MNRLDGKTGIVTGGTQGLGAAIALRFAEAGAAGIVICGRATAKGEAVAKQISVTTSANVRFVRTDLGEVDECRAVVAAVLVFGGLAAAPGAAQVAVPMSPSEQPPT